METEDPGGTSSPPDNVTQGDIETNGRGDVDAIQNSSAVSVNNTKHDASVEGKGNANNSDTVDHEKERKLKETPKNIENKVRN